MAAEADIFQVLRGGILGLEWVFLESLKLDFMNPLHPLRSKPLAQHTPFQTLELNSLHLSLQPCKMPKQLQGTLPRIANHVYTGLVKAQSGRDNTDPGPLLKAPYITRDMDPNTESSVPLLCAEAVESSGWLVSASWSSAAWNYNAERSPPPSPGSAPVVLPPPNHAPSFLSYQPAFCW